MKKVIRLTVLTAMSLFTATAVEAKTEIETTLAADVVSQYIWRGLDSGHTSLQPTLGIGYKGLSLTAWGSTGLTDSSDTREFDLTLGYTISGFNVGITDYWFSNGLDPLSRYFKYDAHGTNHVFEANVGYDFGWASIQWFTNFAGNDGRTQSDKRAYSSYFEISAPFRLGGMSWKATAGAVPYATSFYRTEGFAVTNISLRATKDIRITDSFSIPIFGQITANPSSQDAYLVFGFTLRP